jgi:Protein of unknown function (DUF1573)
MRVQLTAENAPLASANSGPRGRLSPWLRRSLLWTLLSCSIAALGGSALWIYGVAQYGSLSAGLLALQGYALAPTPRVQVISSVSGRTEVPFKLQNLTSAPVTIVGAKSSCGCTALHDLPITIPAREEAELTVFVSPSASDVGKSIQTQVLLYLDVASPPVILQFHGELVLEATETAVGSNSLAEAHK